MATVIIIPNTSMIYRQLAVLKLIWENISMSAFSRIVFIKTWSCQILIYLRGEEVTEMEAFKEVYKDEIIIFFDQIKINLSRE